MTDRKLIFVLGLSRSGTSALTRVLSLCGCTLPDSLLGAGDLNPKGVWEPVDAVKLNRAFLFRHDVPFGDPSLRLQEEIVLTDNEKESFIGEIQAFLNQCPVAPLLVLKEPSITDVADFWFEAARRNGFSSSAVIAFRHPEEVFASLSALAKDAKPSIENSNAWWLKENLLAERHSRNLSRVFVEYSNLIQDWRFEMARVSDALSVDLQIDETAVDNFLTRDLQHQRRSGAIVETFGNSWISSVYRALASAAKDGPLDVSSLDNVYREYRVSERAFRISWDNFRSVPVSQHASGLQEWLDRWPVLKSGHDF